MTEAKTPATTAADESGRPKAAKRATRGSVQEAIGTLIGDDAARARGRAEKHAGTADAARSDPPQD